MPELPEVETVVRSLRPGLVGRQIAGVRFGRKKMRRSGPTRWNKIVLSQFIESIDRRGKWIIVRLSNGHFLVHLGMTGQLTVGPNQRPSAPHTHVIIDLDAGHQLRFCDPRRFGSFSFFASGEELHHYLNAKLGPEPFALKPKLWQDSLKSTRRCIKATLLDQTVVAGVGNIYADESLFIARIHPAVPAHQVDAPSAERLRKALSKVLSDAVRYRGSSIRDYLDGNGERGDYQNEFRVYGRPGEPCQKCRSPIQRIRLAGRSTHFCPKCQEMGIRDQKSGEGSPE